MKIKVILPARYLVGKVVTKPTGEKEYLVSKEIKFYNKDNTRDCHPNIYADVDVIFLIDKEKGDIIYFPADKEVAWTTDIDELRRLVADSPAVLNPENDCNSFKHYTND